MTLRGFMCFALELVTSDELDGFRRSPIIAREIRFKSVPERSQTWRVFAGQQRGKTKEVRWRVSILGVCATLMPVTMDRGHQESFYSGHSFQLSWTERKN